MDVLIFKVQLTFWEVKGLGHSSVSCLQRLDHWSNLLHFILGLSESFSGKVEDLFHLVPVGGLLVVQQPANHLNEGGTCQCVPHRSVAIDIGIH